MASVVVADYSPDWPAQFERLRGALLDRFADVAIDVQHIGSTSVPGLAAKPVLDLLLGAPTLADIEAKRDALAAFGFEYVPKYERELPDRRYFVRAAGDSLLRAHLHGVIAGGTLWREHLRFRDALRTDDALRDRYQALKRDLAARHVHDKAAYTDAKAPFIRAVLDAV